MIGRKVSEIHFAVVVRRRDEKIRAFYDARIKPLVHQYW
jgi:hypothetical protein